MLSFGGFLNSTFWSSYRNQSSASIEEILQSKDCSVEKLLEDDDCLQEFKNLNEKLIQYFNHDKLKHLVDLITVMPPEDATHNRGHKFPFLANEIFNCEIGSLLDRFFDAPDPSAATEKKDEKVDTPTSPAKEDAHDDDSESAEATNTKVTEKEEDKPAGADEDSKMEQEKEEFPASVTESITDTIMTEEKKEDEVSTLQAKEETEDEQKVTSEEKLETETKESEIEKVAEKVEESEEKKDTTSTPATEDVEMKEEEQEGSTATTNVEVEEDEQPVEEVKETTTTESVEEPKAAEETKTLEEQVEEEQDGGKYMLLERLMKFIRNKEKNLNAVLSGYFAKLFTLLLTRKQKNILPFIFGPGSDVVEQLLNHVYQKSIAEFINKLLNIQEEDTVRQGNAAIVPDLKQAQAYIINALVEKLGPINTTEEDNLNASSILQDSLETKEYYSVVAQKSNILKLLEYALPNADQQQPNVDSQNAALGVLTQLVSLYPDRKKEGKRKQSDDDEEDQTTVQQNNNKDFEEDEDESSEGSIISLFARNVTRVVSYLQAQTEQVKEEQLDTSYDTKIAPLGSLRLKLIEFIYHLMKLNNENVLQALAGTNFFSQLSGLLEAYPWNNFLQLKALSIFDEILDSQNSEFRTAALSSSNIGQTLISMANKAKFKHSNDRSIRHGYMAIVVKISNSLVNKGKDKDWIQAYLESLGEDWRLFVEGELKRSNDTNSKSLGGQQPRPSGSDDDDMEGSMSMDSILSRFSNFNTEMAKRASLSNNGDEDEDEDEDEDNGGENHEDEDKDAIMKERDQQYESAATVMPTSTEVKGEEPLVKEFVDLNYWKINILEEKSIEELMAEMEI